MDNRSILITGGTGSFGQAFTKLILSKYDPKRVRIFSRGELLQEEMARKFKDLEFVIGDIRDREAIYRAMKGIDTVVHAAALKMIPVCERNPLEAIKTNIQGTRNTIAAARDCGVEKFFALSTDKAVAPLNLYGATKMVMEKLCLQSNGETKFSCSRYGNVFNARGEVVSVFMEQAKAGTLTLTDPKMSRFWLTMEEAIEFVLRCIQGMQGGEIFVPKLPSIWITDLVQAIAPNAELRYIGIRPGEKLAEVLIVEDEARHVQKLEDHFRITPAQSFPTPIFRYASDTNSWWLSTEELVERIGKMTLPTTV